MDNTQTSFPKMGEDAIHHLMNVSGMSSPNTKAVKKKSGKGGAQYPERTKSNRKGKLESMGASLHPTTTLYKQNAAAASDTGRNVRTVPSAVGNRDFYAKRQYGQKMQ